MPNFTDALRGYAFETMARDGFKCRYCGLNGMDSFANWLALSEDHLLPKGHPERNNRDFIVCACNFCNTADNRYFDLIEKRGLKLDSMTAEQLIEQRRPFVEATRNSYKDFWESRVRDSRPQLPTDKREIEHVKRQFVDEVAKVTTDEGAARNAIIAALQHNPTYISPNVDGMKFRSAFSNQLRCQREKYNGVVSDEEHCFTITQISDSMSGQFGAILRDGRLRIGTVQKAFNLYLKTVWCMGLLSAEPPHCPVDGIILGKARIVGKWTELALIDQYMLWINKIRAHAKGKGFESLSEWELLVWG